MYHSGNEAVKGHYITDVYHLGLNQWLRCDDGIIKVRFILTLRFI